MPGPSHRGDLPPEVPSGVPGEYAAAYRAAFQQALHELEQVPDGTTGEAPADGAGDSGDSEGIPQTSVSVQDDESWQPGSVPVRGDPRTTEPHPTEYRTTEYRTTEYRTRQRWLVPVVMAAVALLFIGCAYALGRMVSGGPEGSTASSSRSAAGPGGDTQTRAQTGAQTGDQSPAPESEPGNEPWAGAVRPVQPVRVSTACRAPDGVDATGAKVSYRASQMADGKTDTAWRCEGTAIGQRIIIRLPAGTKLAEVGLIPGYAKTDSRTDADRYAENNRITRVTWILADGTQIEQVMSSDPENRSMRAVRVPATTGERLVLRVDEVDKGARNTTMISELRVAAAAR